MVLNSLRQNIFSRLFVVLSVAAVLVITVSLGSVAQSLSQLADKVHNSSVLHVFLDPQTSVEKETQVLSGIKKIEGTSDVEFFSREKAAQIIARSFPVLYKDVQAMDADLIPKYIRLRTPQAQRANVEEQIKKLTGVETIENFQLKKSQFLTLMSRLKNTVYAMGLGCLLALISIFVSHFKIANVFQAQMRSTLVMMGATRSKAYLPFVMEGFTEGLAASVLACAGLALTSGLLQTEINVFLKDMGYPLVSLELGFAYIVVLFLGLAGGVLGSVWVALKS